MLSTTNSVRQAALAVIVAAAGFQVIPVHADEGFPFGLEMTLDVAAQPGSKRLPTLEIGDSGEATLDLWCKAGKGQFKYRDLCRCSAAGSCLPAGAGAGRR